MARAARVLPVPKAARASLALPLLIALLFAAPASAVNIDWVAIGNPGNAADTASNCATPNCGSVPYAYYMSKYEVTNAQYTEFLNAVAAADPTGLFNSTFMASNSNGGITRSGSSGSYTYSVKPGHGNNPVTFVSQYDALRFTNWLVNGQPTGAQGSATTEDGAYTFSGATTVGGRNVTATIFLPTESEWYKAAYYDAISASFFDYATGSNTIPTSQAPPGGPNSANFHDAVTGYALTGSLNFDPTIDYLTDVGAYASSTSPYGTFDQSGNALEWVEPNAFVQNAVLRGGSFLRGSLETSASGGGTGTGPLAEGQDFGFRVASLVPEPDTGLLVMVGMLGLAVWRRRCG